MEFEHFTVNGPYIPGHFKGGRVWAANSFRADLVRVSQRAHSVRLEFSGAVFGDLTQAAFAAQKDNRSWQVEFPPEALRIL